MSNDLLKQGTLIEIYTVENHAHRGVIGYVTHAFASADHKSICNDADDVHTEPCLIINMEADPLLQETGDAA